MSKLLESQMRSISGNYKLTPATLAHKLNPRFIPAPHLLYISTKIASAIAKGNGRLIISVPPRHGKSELITKYTTVWGLEHFPHWNTILATYGAELSTDFGRAVRDIINANEDLLNVRVRTDASRTANWKTETADGRLGGGGMAAVGIGGAITGRGANILLIDDYIKEIKEATSKAYKDYLWDWFVTVALTRLEPGGTCIIIATRWAEDDLIGRILRNNPGGRWDYIELPALAMEDDVLGRAVGEPLFPERYDLEALMERKDTLGSFFFNALFQQRPDYMQNGITDSAWLKISDSPPPLQGLRKARIWDFAATPQAGDWTVGLNMTYNPPTNSTYILDVIRGQWSAETVETKVRNTALADGTDTEIYIEQEPGSSGKTLIEYYQKVVLPEFKVTAVPSSDGKIARAQPFLAGAEAGRVYLLRAAWNTSFIDEFARFPGGDHDDQIDTASIGYSKLANKKTFSATWGRRTENIGGTDRKIVTPNHKSGIIFGRNRRPYGN